MVLSGLRVLIPQNQIQNQNHKSWFLGPSSWVPVPGSLFLGPGSWVPVPLYDSCVPKPVVILTRAAPRAEAKATLLVCLINL